MSELKCTRYVFEHSELEEHSPCHCPVCGGFLTSDLFSDPMICKKCGSELLIIPDTDEETGEELEYGKICPISRPKEAKQKWLNED